MNLQYHNVAVRNCKIRNYFQAIYEGYYLYPVQQSAIIEGNTLFDNGVGVYLAHGINALVQDNNISDNNGGGIQISDSTNPFVKNNNLNKNGPYPDYGGILLLNVNNGFLTLNNITDNGRGIYLQGSTGNFLTKNYINASKSTGIAFSSANQNIANENIVCFSASSDFYAASTVNEGDENTCNTTTNWKDIGMQGCTYHCSCLRDATTSLPYAYQQGPWSFNVEEVNRDGLVLKNIAAKGISSLEILSTPKFKLNYGNNRNLVVEFDEQNDLHNHNSIGIKRDALRGKDTLFWDFERRFNQPELQGTLCVSYDMVVRWNAEKNCEGTNRDCYSLVPKVSFKWIDESGSQQSLAKVTAYYKEDFGKQGLTRTSDEDNLLNFGLHTFGLQPVITSEVAFSAIVNGNKGSYDNIHPARPKEQVTIPGCRDTPLDCLHQHWRWSSIKTPWLSGLTFGGIPPAVDPMREPSNNAIIAEALRGTPYLVPGQSIDVAIVKDNPSDPKPDTVNSLVNNENIAAISFKEIWVVDGFVSVPVPSEVQSAMDTVVWYIASVQNTDHAVFHRHGFFVVDDQQATNRGALVTVRNDLTNFTQSSGNVSQVLLHLDESIKDQYWMENNNSLAPSLGVPFFSELVNATDLLFSIKRENTSLVDPVESALGGILSAGQGIVAERLSDGVDHLDFLTQLNNSGFPGLEGYLFNSSLYLNLSLEHYLTALNGTDLNASLDILANFSDAWTAAFSGQVNDADNDFIPDEFDNCQTQFNDQLDSDRDTRGDVCDICPLDRTDTCNLQENVAKNLNDAGGLLQVPSNRSDIFVTQGALRTDRTVFISGASSPSNALAYYNATPLSLNYTFGPNERLLQFIMPATLSLSYNGLPFFNEANLDLFVFNSASQTFEPQGSQCDTQLKRCSLEVTSLSSVILGEFPENSTLLRMRGTPRIGQSITVKLSDHGNPNTPYIVLMSVTGTTPGIPIGDSRVIPLNYDGVFEGSLYFPTALGLQNSQSTLDNQGNAVASWSIPNLPLLAGLKVSFAFVTLDLTQPQLPKLIKSISDSVTVTLVP